MSVTWQTKWGTRRVKVELPTLEEALFAAETMTTDPQQRIEIAASLMGVSLDEVKLKARQTMRRQTIVPTGARGVPGRAIVVERKAPRRTFTRVKGAA